VVVVVLFNAGDHVPLIPFVEVVGKVNVPPLQIGATWLKVGTVKGLTVAAICTGVDWHPFAVAVTEYVTVWLVALELVNVLFIRFVVWLVVLSPVTCPLFAADQLNVLPATVEVKGIFNVPPLQIVWFAPETTGTEGAVYVAVPVHGVAEKEAVTVQFPPFAAIPVKL
jgi:hypothetical protein